MFYLFTAITCALPISSNGATIDCSSTTGDPANFGEKCTYTCDEGYGDSGTGEITCGDKDGSPTGEFDAPQCQGNTMFDIFCIQLYPTNNLLLYGQCILHSYKEK